MSYLLATAISPILLFLWSKPDPAGPEPETLNSLLDRDRNREENRYARKGAKR